MGDFRTTDPAEATEGSFRLTILFRYLSMVHGQKNQGAWVLMPSHEHTGILKEAISGSEVVLNMATLSLEGAAGPLPLGTTKLKRAARVPDMSLLEDGSWKPRQELLERPPQRPNDLSPLSMRMFLPGGTITAYPPSGFPEHAETRSTVGNAKKILLTDTILYTRDLPVGDYYLKVESPRLNVQFNFNSEARFEIMNEDLRREAVGSARSGKEFDTLFDLLEKQLPGPDRTPLGPLSDDIWPCPTGSTGTFTEL